MDWGSFFAVGGLSLQWKCAGSQLQGHKLRSMAGELHKGDLLVVPRDGGIAAGFAKLFGQSADGSFWCLLSFLRPLGGCNYDMSPALSKMDIVRAEHIANSVPYLREGFVIQIIASRDVLRQFVH